MQTLPCSTVTSCWDSPRNINPKHRGGFLILHIVNSRLQTIAMSSTVTSALHFKLFLGNSRDKIAEIC